MPTAPAAAAAPRVSTNKDALPPLIKKEKKVDTKTDEKEDGRNNGTHAKIGGLGWGELSVRADIEYRKGNLEKSFELCEQALDAVGIVRAKRERAFFVIRCQKRTERDSQRPRTSHAPVAAPPHARGEQAPKQARGYDNLLHQASEILLGFKDRDRSLEAMQYARRGGLLPFARKEGGGGVFSVCAALTSSSRTASG